MTKTVVVYHSGYGHTQRVAQFVAEGAGAELVAIDANGDLTEAQWSTLDAADAIIFGAPTYMGSASWQFKKFSDASSKRWFVRGWADKVAGGFTCSNSPSGDKLSTIQSFVTLAMQHGMVWVGLSAMNDGNINRLGSFTGAMAAQEGPTKSAEELHTGDLETAKVYGKRVAEIAAKLRG
ncbi:flavodoxin family protein [Curvibacter sp. CHRR-16]|uniref:flavodoxin family protein n=1 Tax=Curvibacter sp. CHRR-16 TaxID=2835872 RepID=UPI001BD92FF5|nr:flavodoxin family protein [Curvibacter sp. CHRR-16]MBT0568959.1 flavodoxin family protein [Curvibacter sp. CHRR-16]